MIIFQRLWLQTRKFDAIFFLILNFIQQICSGKNIRNISHYKEIFVFKDFEIENGMLGLERDIYLSIVKFLDSSILRKVLKYFCTIFILFLIVHWNLWRILWTDETHTFCHSQTKKYYHYYFVIIIFFQMVPFHYPN
jgi:hypothetical protein